VRTTLNVRRIRGRLGTFRLSPFSSPFPGACPLFRLFSPNFSKFNASKETELRADGWPALFQFWLFACDSHAKGADIF